MSIEWRLLDPSPLAVGELFKYTYSSTAVGIAKVGYSSAARIAQRSPLPYSIFVIASSASVTPIVQSLCNTIGTMP